MYSNAIVYKAQGNIPAIQGVQHFDGFFIKHGEGHFPGGFAQVVLHLHMHACINIYVCMYPCMYVYVYYIYIYIYITCHQAQLQGALPN
jgi:hypothetical protein